MNGTGLEFDREISPDSLDAIRLGWNAAVARAENNKSGKTKLAGYTVRVITG